MKHVPAIYEKSEVEEKKWAYKPQIACDHLEIVAVDSKTGEELTCFLSISDKGVIDIENYASRALLRNGYTEQGLQFDKFGAIKVK